MTWSLKLGYSGGFCSLLLVSLLALSGCSKGSADSEAPAQKQAKTQSGKSGNGEPVVVGVAKIVMLDKEECCECTGARQKASLDAMKSVIEARGSKATLEVIHLDTQPDEAQPYLAMKPLMVPPGMYFLDASGNLLELLQGEVTAEQIEQVFAKLDK